MKVSEYRDGLPTPEIAESEAVLRFPLNDQGRDFVVGDIHGMFQHLTQLLDKIGFDEEHDRLFSVGDLVDRGPESKRALEWLDKPWFYACRGNHEQFAIDSDDPEQLDVWVNYNGGEWWLDLDIEDGIGMRRSMPCGHATGFRACARACR
jgi:serine/threonine protein phosphatase 1